MRNSYIDDCIFLLKELEIKEITIEEKEKLISEGKSYSEMISKENKPSEELMKIFHRMLLDTSEEIAQFIAYISEKIYKKKGKNLVIVSLARAGTPIGILIKKYIKEKYKIAVPHYSISIIRGSGIDKNAISYILKNNPQCNIQFVDGWTGKGSITKELKSSINTYNMDNDTNIDHRLAVLIDPAKLCTIYGTREDFGLPTSCLNSTVSGLISRTIFNEKYIKKDDFHGAKYLEYLKEHDVSNLFVESVSKKFKNIQVKSIDEEEIDLMYAENITKQIKQDFKVKDINKIKLSVGETARVLLRRNPRVILIKDRDDKNIKHILKLAEEKQVEVKIYDCRNYNCISIIEE